ncbi:hypothetical protein [Pseudomonas putida]
MKFNVPRMVLFSLFAFAAVGSASATQTNPSTLVAASKVAAIAAPARAADNPWPSMASSASKQAGPLLAHDERYRDDRRWHERREDWRRAQWRREQHRREIERRREWQRRHDRAMQHHYDRDDRYYRR